VSGGNCPFCLSPIVAGQEQHTCEACGTEYHQECFEFNGSCGTFGCPAWTEAQAAATAAAPVPERTTATVGGGPGTTPVGAAAPAVLNFCDHCGAGVSGPGACPSCGEVLEA
jgi:hypothetical protein